MESTVEMAWCARAGMDRRAALAELRLEPGVEVCTDGAGTLWLRGPQLSGSVRRRLARGAARVYAAGEGGLLLNIDGPPRGVPVARAPEGPWAPAETLIEPVIGAAALAGVPRGGARLGVLRGGPERAPRALRLTLEELLHWANMAPGSRMETLRFAADDRGRALVIGEPLPPLGRELFWAGDGVLVPAGHRVDPDLGTAVARQVLGRNQPGSRPEDLFLLEASGVALVRAAHVLPLTRAAVRATQEPFG